MSCLRTRPLESWVTNVFVQDSDIFTRDIQIFVKTLAGRTILLNTRPSATVGSLYEEIQSRDGHNASAVRLIYGGKALEKDRMLYEYGISGNETLDAVLRLLGGMQPSGLLETYNFGR